MPAEELKQKLLTLSTRAWDGRVDWQAIERWLGNFQGLAGDKDRERLHALFLLSHVCFFSLPLIRELLRTLYRQLYRYPIIKRIRENNGDTTDVSFITQEFEKELNATRFLGIGNPSESGPHLLYYFRQVNELPKRFFVDSAEILNIIRDPSGAAKITPHDATVKRYVYIDDLLGSGQQISSYLPSFFAEIRRAVPDVQICYYALFATTDGLSSARTPTLFGGNVDCIFELDESFKCFSSESRYFAATDGDIDPSFAREMAGRYGEQLLPAHPLGYKEGQLLLAFDHNTPDNTLPIVWSELLQPIVWVPIFKRFQKIY